MSVTIEVTYEELNSSVDPAPEENHESFVEPPDVYFNSTSIEVESEETTVVVDPPVIEHLTVTVGEAPPITGQYTFERVSSAGELSALRVVSEDETGKVAYTDPTVESQVEAISGLTTTAGSVVVVQRDGFVNTSGLGLPLGRVYLGESGRLTSDPPATGYLVSVGSVTSPNRLYLNISEPILLTSEVDHG